MQITVYSKPLCVQCDATKRELNKTTVSYDIIDVTVDDEALAEIKSMGFAHSPVVIVRDTVGDIIDSWSGFRKERIQAVVASMESLAATA